MTIKDYWIKSLAETTEFQAISDTEDFDFDIFIANLGDLLDDQFIQLATEYGIARRETMLNIIPLSGETLEIRRDKVALSWDNGLPYTYNQLDNKLRIIAGEGTYSLVLTENDYTLTVSLELAIKDLWTAIENAVQTMIPSNMVVVIELVYNTYDSLSGFTYDELSAYTHADLREGVFV